MSREKLYIPDTFILSARSVDLEPWHDEFVSIEIPKDARAFNWRQTTFSGVLAGVGTIAGTSPLFTITMMISSSGRDLLSMPLTAQELSGLALAEPRLLLPDTRIDVQLRNTGTLPINFVTVSLVGEKIFEVP